MSTTKPMLLSGGHKGAEAEFGRAAKRWGLEQTTFSFEGHAMEWPMSVRVLTDAELAAGDVSMEIVSKRMGRGYHRAELIRRVIQSIYHMVNGAYQVFVIGSIQSDDTVKGGTGWAVELAKMFNREVHVYDQSRGEWFSWRDRNWQPDEPKIAEKSFCGTGTRNLTDEGKGAIEELYRRSFGDPPA